MKNRHYILVLFFFISTYHFSISQESYPVTIEIKNGVFPKKMPHGVKFNIKMDGIVPEKKDSAQSVELKIIQKHKDPSKYDTVFTQGINRVKNETTITIPVDIALYPNKEYKFNFLYKYIAQVNQDVVKNFIIGVIEASSDSFSKNEIFSREEANQVIKDSLDTFYKRNNYEYKDQLEGSLSSNLTANWISEMMTLATLNADKKRKALQRDSTYKALKDTVDIVLKKSDSIPEFDSIKASIQRIQEIGTDAYTPYFINHYLNDTQNIKDYLRTVDQNPHIENIFSSLLAFEDYNEKYEEYNTKSETQALKMEKFNKPILNSKLIHIKEVPKDYSTAADDINDLERIGLRYGIAYSPLGGDQIKLYQFIMTRFYFSPLDKSMKEPYKINKGWSRFSLNIGAAVGSISNKGGRGIENVEELGLKLMTGVGFDWTKQLALSAGVLWFDYKEGSPFNRQRLTKGTFYLGLDFDFNIIENLKKGVNK